MLQTGTLCRPTKIPEFYTNDNFPLYGTISYISLHNHFGAYFLQNEFESVLKSQLGLRQESVVDALQLTQSLVNELLKPLARMEAIHQELHFIWGQSYLLHMIIW